MTVKGDNEWGPDFLLLKILQHAPPEDKTMLAAAFGSADTISRHLPVWAVPGAIKACWLTALAAEMTEAGDPYGPAMWRAARAYLDEASIPMIGIVGQHIPNDPRSLTEGG